MSWVLVGAQPGDARAQLVPTAKATATAVVTAPPKKPVPPVKPGGGGDKSEPKTPGGGETVRSIEDLDIAKKKEALTELLAEMQEARGATEIVAATATSSSAGKLMAEAKAVHGICSDMVKARALPGVDQKALATFDTNVCKRLCYKTVTPGTSVLDFCALKKPVLAYAAVLSDSTSAEAIIEYTAAARKTLGLKPAEGGKAKSEIELLWESSSVRKSAPGTDLVAAPEKAIAELSVQALQTGLTALAKLIEDRAKREGIAWFLQRVGADMCGEDDEETARASEATLRQTLHSASCMDKDNRNKEGAVQKRKEAAENTAGRRALIQREIRTYWFPAVCGLAGKRGELLSQYGGGGKLLDGLRSAIALDMKGWPGVSAGLGLGAAFWSDLPNPPADNLFFCTGDKNEAAECAAVTKVRRAGAAFIDDIMAGGGTTSAFYTLGTKLDSANLRVASDKIPAEVLSDAFQVAACTASLPAFFEQNAESLPKMAELDALGRAQALTIAAFAASPACWTITGKGADKAKCDVFGGTGGVCTSVTALAVRGSNVVLERLSTVSRLAAPFEAGGREMSVQWNKLESAIAFYKSAAKNAQKALSDSNGGSKAPDLSKLTDPKDTAAIIKAAQEFAQAQIKLDQLGPVQKQLQAAVAVAQAAFDLGGTAAGTLEGALDADLYPGLGKRAKEKTKELHDRFSGARDTMDAVSKDLAVVSSIIGQDWGTLATASISSARSHMKIACATGAGGSCLGGLDTLVRHVGFVVALVGEKDPDQLANALDSLADPPGGWRSKSKPGSFTISLGSFPGFAVGAEARQGQYGVARESYDRGFYFNTPALVMPVGFDFSWGNDTCFSPLGLFVSVLDPAAFLQYDSNEDGRLPGPRVTTALSPGAWGRIGIKDTPLSFNPYLVWRPGLRGWDASVSGPAADAFQIGMAVSVDVTLWELYAKRGGN